MSHAENVLRRCRTIVFAATLLVSVGAAAQTEWRAPGTSR